MEKYIEDFEKELERYSEEDRYRIIDAAHWSKKLHSDQKRASGEPYFIHPLNVARILVELRMDADSVIAALLHDILEDTPVTKQELTRNFSKEITALVNGVTKISILKAKNKNVQEAETIRKMLFAMIKDIRVILIKLADKLHNMRTLSYMSSKKQAAIARECLDIYAPLAGRLGISWLKDELEDLALKHLNHPVYNQIREHVSAKKTERSDFLQRVKEQIYREAASAGLSITVEMRAKHFYSVYKKMKIRQKNLSEIYDLLGIRIICSTVGACYEMVGIVHQLWKPLEGRFKDYIALPKANRYQSLHTTVMGDEGRPLEIQIRTKEMHRTAEHGIAAHWLYKEGSNGAKVQPEELAIVNKLKNWNKARVASREFLNEIKSELLKDSIYVFTPKGDAIELPKGSTAIDFAYHIHTEVGNHCRMAKSNDQIIQLHEELKNTQVIEIITSPNARPNVNWLRYVKTSRARGKIRNWLNKHDENLLIDSSIVVKNKDKVEKNHKPPERKRQPRKAKKASYDKKKVNVRVGNESNMMIRIAQCCNPSAGDPIIGYVSRGRGIIVHKRNCKNLQNIEGVDQRTIEVEWETVSPKETRSFELSVHNSQELTSKVEGAIRKYEGHVIASSRQDFYNGKEIWMITLEYERGTTSKLLMNKIHTIPTVANIREVKNGFGLAL